MVRGDTIRCSECKQIYRQGFSHNCISLAEAAGYDRNASERVLPKNTRWGDLDARLPAPDGKPGITLRDLIKQARDWWNTKGRHMTANLKRQGDTNSTDYIPSKLLDGFEFERLTATQASDVCDIYYEYIWYPMQADQRPDSKPIIMVPKGGGPNG